MKHPQLMTESELLEMLPLNDAIVEFVKFGKGEQRCGGFLKALLTNDLSLTVQRADHTNLWLIPYYVFYLTWYCPMDCWGSEEKFKNWEGLEN